MRVCIEGPSGAGKSTLASILHQIWEDINLCPTIDRFIGGFPVSKKSSDIADNFHKYIRGENLAFCFMNKNEGDWIQDRNWVSQITFLESVEVITGLDLRPLRMSIVEQLELGNIAIPSTFLYLHCSPTLTATRRQKRGAAPWGDVPPWICKRLRPKFRELRYKSYETFFHLTLSECRIIEAKNSLKILNDLEEKSRLETFTNSNEIISRLRNRAKTRIN